MSSSPRLEEVPMTMSAVQAPGRISYEDFLAAVDEGTHAEWVEGEVVRISPSSKRHARIASFLHAALKNYVVRKKAGEVLHMGFQMKLPGSGREPDVLFLSNEHLHRWKETYIDGPADLVIEITSPATRSVDLGDKLREYERGGVREYWIVDLRQEKVSVYRPGADGRYEHVEAGNPHRIESRVLPGLWIDPAWLWSDPIKDLWEVYEEWGLV